MSVFCNPSYTTKNIQVWFVALAWISGCFITFDLSASDSEQGKVRAVIEAQIDAMAMDDWPKAYSYAAPSIRKRFGNPQYFRTMVLRGYKIVYRPRIVSFEGKKDFGDTPGYVFHMVGLDGKAARVAYFMVNDRDEGWRIAGVQLFAIKGKII